MRWIGFTATGVVLLVLHVLVGTICGPQAAEWLPDPLVWLLCGPVLWGLAAEALTAGWILGFMRDLVLPDPFGLHSLALACAAFPAWQLRQGFDVRRPSARVITALAIAGAYAIGVAVGRAVVGDAAIGGALQRALLPVLATAALAPGAVRSLGWLPFVKALERRTRFLRTA